MLIMLGFGMLLFLMLLYALCRIAGEADKRLESIYLQHLADKGGE